jgi:hypothetical protein
MIKKAGTVLLPFLPQAIKKVPFLMGGADPLKFCGIFGRGSGRGSVFSRYAL